jgi:hypothetical protein
MARSAHAYVRGATRKFYEWLEQSNGHAIPEGPPIWICGDCHVGNLGPVADAKGNVTIQIRDLDQTVVGNPAHDLIRLGLSLATAARGSDLPGVTTAQIVEHLMDGYDNALGSAEDAEWIPAPEPVVAVLKKAFQRRWRHLAEERIEDVKPKIPLGKRFWPLSDEERVAIRSLGDSENLRQLVTHLRSRKDGAPVQVLDAAYWVKGCSSLGRLRYAVLLRVKGAGDGSGMCLINPAVAWTAGAMISTLADLRLWAKALATGALLTPARHAEQMRFGTITTKPLYVGYGFGIANFGGLIGHNGAIFGYTTAMFYWPEADAMIVLAGNQASNFFQRDHGDRHSNRRAPVSGKDQIGSGRPSSLGQGGGSMARRTAFCIDLAALALQG